MALSALLVESMQCYRDGLPTTHGREYERIASGGVPAEFAVPQTERKNGEQAFKDFFDFPSHRVLFPKVDGGEFYRSIRNGLLHQAQTKSGWRIRIGRTELWDVGNKVVDRNKFVQALKTAFNEYTAELSRAAWGDEVWVKARRKIWWLIKLSS